MARTPDEARDSLLAQFDLLTGDMPPTDRAALIELLLEDLDDKLSCCCTTCAEPNDNGEGFNGLCGNCADKKESK